MMDCLDQEDARLLAQYPRVIGAFPAVEEHLELCGDCAMLCRVERAMPTPDDPEPPQEKVILSHNFVEPEAVKWLRAREKRQEMEQLRLC